MNDPKFIKSELRVTASEELEQEIKEELENSEQVRGKVYCFCTQSAKWVLWDGWG